MRFWGLVGSLSRHRGIAGFAIGVVGTAMLAGGGMALAAIPSSETGDYTACVAPYGNVRIIDVESGKRCNASEKMISWSRGWTYRGSWSQGTEYVVGDVVVDAGSSYVAVAPSSGAPPASSPTAWGLLAAAGEPGSPGGAAIHDLEFGGNLLDAGSGTLISVSPSGCISVASAETTAAGDVPLPVGETITGITLRWWDVAPDADARLHFWKRVPGSPPQELGSLATVGSWGFGTLLSPLNETVDPGESFWLDYKTNGAPDQIGVCSIQVHLK